MEFSKCIFVVVLLFTTNFEYFLAAGELTELSEDENLIPKCEPNNLEENKCLLQSMQRLNFKESHQYCREQEGFLPAAGDLGQLKELPVLEIWTGLTLVEGNFQWRSRNPVIALSVPWEGGSIPEPREATCIIYNIKKKSFTPADCMKILPVICIVDKARERALKWNTKLHLSSNFPDQSGWIEVSMENFRNLILSCSAEDESGRVNSNAVHWSKDGVWITNNNMTIQPSLVDDLTLHQPIQNPPEFLVEATQQGTYCCETWKPKSIEIVRSNCLLVTIDQFTTLVLTAVTASNHSRNDFLSYLKDPTSSLNTSLLITSIGSNFRSPKASEFKYRIYFQGVPIEVLRDTVNKTLISFGDHAMLKNTSEINFATYCKEKTVSYDYGNEVSYPFARAGSLYNIPYKCETKNNKLTFQHCQWSFTDGAKISTFESQTCQRFDMCPRGFKIISGRVCVKIIRNVTWEEGFAQLYQTGHEETLFGRIEYHEQGNVHEKILEYLVEEKASIVWLPVKRKYNVTSYVDRSVNQKFYGNLKRIAELNNTNEIHNSIYTTTFDKRCKVFNTSESRLVSVECFNRYNLVILIDIRSYKLHEKFNLCQEGWNRVPINSTEQKCLGVFYVNESYSSWNGAKKICALHDAKLPFPGRSFMDWVLRSLLKENETIFLNISGEGLNSTDFDFLNWLPGTNWSLNYGIMNKTGWTLADKRVKNLTTLICEKQVKNQSIPLRLILTKETWGENGTKSLCLRTNNERFLANYPIICLVNGATVESGCLKWRDCQCLIPLTEYGNYECRAWSNFPFKQVWSNLFVYIDNIYTSFKVIGTVSGYVYNPNLHDPTIYDMLQKYPKHKKKFEPFCFNKIFEDLYKVSGVNNFTNVRFENKSGTFGFSFYLQCSKPLPLFCQSTESVFNEVNQSLMNQNHSHGSKVKCFVDEVRSTVGCKLEIQHPYDGQSLTWSATKGNGAFLPEELCVLDNGHPKSRICNGNFIYGHKWSHFPSGKCIKTLSESTKNLWKLHSQPNFYLESLSISQLTNNVDSIIVADIVYVASIMQYFARNSSAGGQMRFDEIVASMNNILRAKASVLSEAQNYFGSTSKILKSFELLSLNNDESVISFDEESLLIKKFNNLKDSLPTGFRWSESEGFNLIKSKNEIDLDHVETAIAFPNNMTQKVYKKTSRLSFIIYKTTNIFFDSEYDGDLLLQLKGKVISASYQKVDEKILNYEGVKIYFRPNYHLYDALCVYWDYQKNGETGGWSRDGCQLLNISDNLATCECFHFSHFAILVFGIHTYTLSLLSIVGCSLSIVCLLSVPVTYIIFDKFRRSQDNKILVNLSIAMCLSFIMLLYVLPKPIIYKIEGLEGKFVHEIAAVVITLYFVLASFGWMLVESFHHYYKFVRNIPTSIIYRRFILKSSIFAWGAPVVPIVVAFIVQYYMQDTRFTFWEETRRTFLFVFVPHMAIILALNAVIYINVVASACKPIPSQLGTTQCPKKRLINEVSMAICVFFLLGFTWILGFIILFEPSIFFGYTFVFCNITPGFLIFYSNIYNNEQVRRLWIDYVKAFWAKPRDEINLTSQPANKWRWAN